MYIDQPQLVGEILKLLERKFGVKTVNQRQINAVIRAADTIIRDIERPNQEALPGMTVDEWLRCDDTGLSSIYMASVLFGFVRPPAYPIDPDDFGRCYRLLENVSGARERLARMAECGPAWKRYIEHWDEMERLWCEELPSGRCPRLYELMQRLQNEASWET